MVIVFNSLAIERPILFCQIDFMQSRMIECVTSSCQPSSKGESSETLICPSPQKRPRNGPQQDLPIERQRPVVDILHVHLHPGLEIHTVPAGKGPQAGQPWAHPQTPALPALVLIHFTRNCRTWSYQRHVASQDIPQLRPLVNREFPQIPSHSRYARVVGNLEGGLPDAEVRYPGLQGFSILAHGAEFVE